MEDRSVDELDPGSWRKILEETLSRENISSTEEGLYISGVNKMMFAVSEGEPELMKEAILYLHLIADGGYAHAQSTLGFLYEIRSGVEQSDAKAFLYHHFAAEGGNFQSKMALAYTYYHQQMYEKSIKLYAELASVAVASFLSFNESPLIEPVRINDGAEENKEALRKSRGEEDDDFQIIEYQAQKGSAVAMYRLGIFYYFGLRGVRRDHGKALSWFLRAVDKGDPNSMEFLGEIYARGSGVERNFTKALEWFKAASRRKRFSAYNGIGYLYMKGHGVEKKNYTKAREFFKKAAENDDPNGHGNYNLGVLYLKGLGVKKDIKLASRYFITAANSGQPKAFYQLGKMFQKGIGLKKNFKMASTFYKLVAERGPWGSLLRWALECYLKGQTGRALLLYSRVAELGYEVAQSNAAWILDKFGEYDICIGKSGFCSDVERHQRVHTLWWHASEQGNEHAALLIGDAYYYGRGTDRDFERAAEAYMHAHSQANAQAMFNLGYMHEHGEGLPFDFHLAKQYYDQALETDSDAKLHVMLALMGVWIRKNYGDSCLMKNYPEDVCEVEVKPDASWRPKIEGEARCHQQWCFPDGSLPIPNGDAQNVPQISKQVKQEDHISENHNVLRIGMKRNQDGHWELNGAKDNQTSSNAYRKKERKLQKTQKCISATRSNGDHQDQNVMQEASQCQDTLVDNGPNCDSALLGLVCPNSSLVNPVSSHLQNEPDVIVLSDSEEEIEDGLNIDSQTASRFGGSDNHAQGGLVMLNTSETLPYGNSIPLIHSSLSMHPMPLSEVSSVPYNANAHFDLFGANDVEFNPPHWPAHSQNATFQLFGTHADASDTSANSQNSSVVRSTPARHNGAPHQQANSLSGSRIPDYAQMSDSRPDYLTTAVNGDLIENSRGIGNSDAPLELFFSDVPAQATIQDDTREPVNSSDSLHTNWISLSLGIGNKDGTCTRENCVGEWNRKKNGDERSGLDSLANTGTM